MLQTGKINRPQRYVSFKYFTLIAVVVGAIFIAGWLIKKDTLKTPESLEGIKNERANWEKFLEKENSRDFYESLKGAYLQNYNQHAVGHIFGEMLYKKEGVYGIKICDDAFWWGCYHSLTSLAIIENGVDIIPELIINCGEKSDFCEHGIGHGLLEYFGAKGMDEALKACSSFFGERDSCLTGIFMEYNFPLGTARAPTNKDYYKPCGSLLEIYQGACYFELPRWWERVFKSDFEKVGKLCSLIDFEENKNQCFLGVGEIVSLITSHELDSTISLCEKMSTTTGIAYCKIGASIGFSTVSGKSGEAPNVCRGIEKKYREQCAR